MTEKSLTITPNQADVEVLPISGTDIKHWEVVQMVQQAFRDGSTNTTDACKAADVSRMLYYRALKNPYVQRMRAQEIAFTAALNQKMIEHNWFEVMARMIRIARSDSGRDAVAAARFLKEIYDEVKDEVEAEAATEEVSGTFLEQFAGGGGKRTYRARRKRGDVVEEVEVEVKD